MAYDGQSPSIDYLAEGIAAHFLKPSIKPSITVGIVGECGSGGVVSSLMNKIEHRLLLTTAQAAFPGKQFNGEQKKAISKKGRRIENGVMSLLAREKQENSLEIFLVEYQPKHEEVYKYLACVELKQLLKHREAESEEETARVLTVKFSAEGYTGEEEACGGLIVEITKAIEMSMTRAQRWTSRCRHNGETFFTIFDFLIAAALFVVIGIVFVFLDHFDVSHLKVGTIPAVVISVALPALKKFVSFYNWKNVSNFVRDHLRSDKSNSQPQTVISKIKFLKRESGKKPWPVFSFISGEKLNYWWGWLEDKIKDTSIPKYGSAPHGELRIIAFLNGFDRFQSSVLVKMLESLNTVVKACEINFVVELDKNIIRKAFNSSSQKEDDADYLISQIIKLPVTLHPVFKASSETQGNTENDEEKQLDPNTIRKPFLTMGNDSEKDKLKGDEIFEKLKCFSREISGIRHNYIKYHKFARNVISQIMRDRKFFFESWEKELAAWIFICFQWRTEMNILIQDWHAYVDVKEKDGEPSLKEVVANYINEQIDSKGKDKNAADSEEEEQADSKTKRKIVVDFQEVGKTKGNKLNGDLSRWKSLHKALDKVQDVSMKGIQYFQYFRFHCDAGYLNRSCELSSN